MAKRRIPIYQARALAKRSAHRPVMDEDWHYFDELEILFYIYSASMPKFSVVTGGPKREYRAMMVTYDGNVKTDIILETR
jgi:hypothetical protein